MSTRNVDTVVIGAGHAGLAVSHLLGRAGRDHVVVDRGRVAEAWRSERWDSLHLLTPRWMTRLPGWSYRGPGQEGFMPVSELVGHLERYAAESAAPLELGREVLEVSAHDDGYRVVADGATWLARHVVVATGPTGRPQLPAAAHALPRDLEVLSPLRYRSPGLLPDGGVLVVGASASGTQIADELARAGRRVVLAVGRHTRMPRRYRGMDVHWWLERTGRLARTVDTLPGPARHEPSFQLAGREPRDPRGADVSLDTLQHVGVEVTGRLLGVEGSRVTFADDLGASARDSDARLTRFLDLVDHHASLHHLTAEIDAPDRPGQTRVADARTALDLRAEGIGSVVLATGYAPHHPWLRVPVTGPGGRIRQVRGVTPAPGLYVVGQRFQHRRDSATVDGARHDARDVVAHLCADDTAALRALELR
ncbi:flavin-containing monooxygenase [Nocardioides sp. MAHUQ-72]|uniref:flavin-containing monooxygenase n=1 Tax=unclassified Nocardioides TaxID=2615069 RepID=UPI003623F1E9